MLPPLPHALEPVHLPHPAVGDPLEDEEGGELVPCQGHLGYFLFCGGAMTEVCRAAVRKGKLGCVTGQTQREKGEKDITETALYQSVYKNVFHPVTRHSSKSSKNCSGHSGIWDLVLMCKFNQQEVTYSAKGQNTKNSTHFR